MTTSRITARPGQILGLRPARRHERPGLYPIFAIAGASPEGDQGGGAAGEGQQQNAGQASGDQGQQQATGQAAAPADWDGKIESLPPAVQKLITDARAEAGKARTSAKEQAAAEARTELLKKLGLDGDGKEVVDPEKLAAQLASKDAQLLQLQRETVASKVARIPAISADIDALLDSRSFASKLGDLDPSSDGFEDKVKTLVETTVKENPKFKAAAQAAGVSGGQFSGGSGEHSKQRPTSLGAALGAAMKP